MVQYILTPWRDRRELLHVRQQFYPDEVAAAASSERSVIGMTGSAEQRRTIRSNDQHQAVARVSMWMQRGGCPHMVESTALLTAAMLGDASSSGDGGGSAGTYVARAAYAAAFSRFVTGLLDGHQDKQRKLSMYAVAKTIGLPATFVELRHQATHEQLPSLAKLRSAARKALTWIWEYYWQHLIDTPTSSLRIQEEASHIAHISTSAKGAPAAGNENPGDCRAVVLAYLENSETGLDDRQILLRQWGKQHILEVMEGIVDDPPSNSLMLKALRSSREILQEEEEFFGEDTVMGENRDTAPGSPGGEEAQEQDSHGTGWSRWQGPWKPKPIGIV